MNMYVAISVGNICCMCSFSADEMLKYALSAKEKKKNNALHVTHTLYVHTRYVIYVRSNIIYGT